MASTRAQLRSLLRDEIGDQERITGTATGGSTTTVIDTVLLTQVNNYWQSQKIHLKDTTDDLAPINETRRISSSAQSTATITVELPFSAAVQAGDTYGIAVFSDARINQAINDALAHFSKWRPHKTTEPLAVSIGNRRFTPTSASTILSVKRIEFFDNVAQEYVDYTGQWFWDDHLRKVEFLYWWTENKTLTIHIQAVHPFLITDSQQVTVLPNEENLIVRLASALLLLSFSEAEFRNDFGALRPSSWKRGEVSESYDDFTKRIESVRKSIMEEIKEQVSEPVFGSSAGATSFSFSGLQIDTKADPDGSPAPQIFWTLR